MTKVEVRVLRPPPKVRLKYQPDPSAQLRCAVEDERIPDDRTQGDLLLPAILTLPRQMLMEKVRTSICAT
jgi:hypothetical protein